MESPKSKLQELIDHLSPYQNSGEYVFCSIGLDHDIYELDVIASFAEKEGRSIVVPKSKAEEMNWKHSNSFAWITLQVYSSLDAVGLTATVSAALTENNISCNIIAAYNHDHLFVPFRDAKRAIQILENLEVQKKKHFS